MKKKVLAFLFALLIIFKGFSLDNGQKIWTVDSDVYQGIKSLYIMEGLAAPSSSGPWSTNELLEMTSLLKDDSSYLYKYVMEELTKAPRIMPRENLGLNLETELNLEVYTRTNTDSDFANLETLAYDRQDMKPFFQFNLETFATDSFYSYVGFDVRNTFHGNEKGDLGYSNFFTNLLFFQDFSLNVPLLSPNFPQRGFVSFGAKNWNVQLGKDRLSWGNGETGNFAISNNLPAHNFVRFSTFFNSLKYSFLTSFFPHQKMYYNGDNWSNNSPQFTKTQGLRFYLAHRIEGRFFNDKLNTSLTEAIIYQSDDGTVNPRIFNPVDMFHNYYIRSNANSTLIFEFDYAPIKKLNIYGQIIVDDLAIPGEGISSEKPVQYPDAMGYMLGAKTSFELNKGVFYGSFEAVKTDPFLYLRDAADPYAVNPSGYGIDYVVAFSEFNNMYGNHYDEYFLGYQYGGDALVFNLNAGWNNYKNLSIEGNVFYMLHGTFDKWTTWTQIGDGTNPNYPKYDLFEGLTSTHPTNNKKDDADAQTRDAISQTLVCGVNITYKLNPTVKFFAQQDVVFVNNYGNHAGVQKVDFQLALGANFSFKY